MDDWQRVPRIVISTFVPYFPAGQAVQAEEPASANVPASQTSGAGVVVGLGVVLLFVLLVLLLLLLLMLLLETSARHTRKHPTLPTTTSVRARGEVNSIFRLRRHAGMPLAPPRSRPPASMMLSPTRPARQDRRGRLGE
jgi:hypothetical protein